MCCTCEVSLMLLSARWMLLQSIGTIVPALGFKDSRGKIIVGCHKNYVKNWSIVQYCDQLWVGSRNTRGQVSGIRIRCELVLHFFLAFLQSNFAFANSSRYSALGDEDAIEASTTSSFPLGIEYLGSSFWAVDLR